MSIATVSSKGQITLPAKSRRAIGIKPLDKVFIDVTDDMIVLRKVPDFLELEGFLGDALPARQERDAVSKGLCRHMKGKR
jgi:AbrB family looped-hinge helix DNA binding protein